jgi:hypothetical protein
MLLDGNDRKSDIANQLPFGDLGEPGKHHNCLEFLGLAH